MNIPEKYPENRLDIRMDEQGNISYVQNPVFSKYYAKTNDEIREEIDELSYELDLLEAGEPPEYYYDEYAEWLENKRNIKDRIEDLRDDLNAL